MQRSDFRDSPDGWKHTYPHKTFVALLKRAAKMLARGGAMDKHSIWVHGAYGTGKSQVVWTLRQLLVCPDAEFDAYFSDYAPLRAEKDLKNTLAGLRKAHKIVVAVRHGAEMRRNFGKGAKVKPDIVRRTLKCGNQRFGGGL